MNRHEIHDIERALNELSTHDRHRASQDFEDRMLNSALRDSTRIGGPNVIARIGFASRIRTPMRIAASIAIIGAIAAALIADRTRIERHHAESVASMMSDVEIMLAIAAELEEGSSEELAMLNSKAATLDEQVRGGLADLIDEGAM